MSNNNNEQTNVQQTKKQDVNPVIAAILQNSKVKTTNKQDPVKGSIPVCSIPDMEYDTLQAFCESIAKGLGYIKPKQEKRLKTVQDLIDMSRTGKDLAVQYTIYQDLLDQGVKKQVLESSFPDFEALSEHEKVFLSKYSLSKLNESKRNLEKECDILRTNIADVLKSNKIASVKLDQMETSQAIIDKKEIEIESLKARIEKINPKKPKK